VAKNQDFFRTNSQLQGFYWTKISSFIFQDFAGPVETLYYMIPYSNNGEHRIPDGGTCNNESSSNQLGEGPKQLGSRVCMAVQYGVSDASQPRGQKFYTPLPSLTPDMQI